MQAIDYFAFVFQELKCREEELRNAQETLRRRELMLDEREFHLIERELHFIFSQDSRPTPTPKKRKGHFRLANILKTGAAKQNISLPSGTWNPKFDIEGSPPV